MPSLTNYGQQIAMAGAISGGVSQGGILHRGVGVALYVGGTPPTLSKGGAYWGVTEVTGTLITNGYEKGSGAGVWAGWSSISTPAFAPWVLSNAIPQAIAGTPVVSGSWTLSYDSSDGNMKATLATFVWTALPSQSIANIGGAFLYDANYNILCWWARSTVQTVTNGDTFSLAGLYLKLT